MPEIKYTAAIARLDELIRQIENEEVDVDELSRHVKEAVKLIQTCKKKIEKAEVEVKNAVEAFDRETA